MEEGTSRTTPCTSEKVMMLYDIALAIQRSPAKGIIVLDCTVKRVKVNENMFEKVAQLQELYQSKGNNMIIAIVYTGKRVLYHFLGNVWTLQSVLERTRFENQFKVLTIQKTVDSILPFLALASKNGASDLILFIALHPNKYRHTFGTRMQCSELVQALGCATFNGRSILEGNGHTQVTYVMTSNDADVVQAYPSYVKEINWRCNNGEYLLEELPWVAASGRSGLLLDETNFLHPFTIPTARLGSTQRQMILERQ
jgi:hypothetical protein